MNEENNLIYENDRITDGFEIFFWVFNDASSYVATHWHSAIEIMYIMEGQVDVTMNKRTISLLPGDVFLLDSKIAHSTQSLHGNHAILIQLPYPLLKRYIPDIDSYNFSFDCHTTNPDVQEKLSQLKEVIHQMRIVFDTKPKGALLRFNSLQFELLYQLYHNFARPLTMTRVKRDIKNFQRMEPILEYTNAHYHQPISLSQIAAVACLQEEYFCHFFKKNTGVTYFQYLNELRLSHIYYDLTATDLSLKELLEHHGFTNYKLFRKMFFEKFQMTPGEYRKSHASKSS